MEICKHRPELKEQLWRGEFLTDGYFVNTVSRFGDETTISKYVKEQGLEKEFNVLHKIIQLVNFKGASIPCCSAEGRFIIFLIAKHLKYLTQIPIENVTVS